MKKWLWMFVVMVMVLNGCSISKSDSTNVTLSKLDLIKEKGVLVLGTSADYPPYEFHKEIDGKDSIVGFDIDIAKAIANEIGVELEVIDMKFEGLLPALTAGKIDMIASGMTPTEERKQSVDFSDVYYDAKQTMLVRTENKAVLNSVESFKGQKVGVQKGSIQEEIAKSEFSEIEIKGLDKIQNLILELKADKVNGLILVENVAIQYAKVNPDLSLNGVDLGSEGGSAIAVQKDSDDLIAVINETLKRVTESGELNQWVIEAIELSEAE